MAQHKKQAEPDPKGRRLQFHPCHLQALHGDGFVRIANEVLRGRMTLLNYRDQYGPETATRAAAN